MNTRPLIKPTTLKKLSRKGSPFLPLFAMVNSDGVLQSLLYDLDLLPEQITTNANWKTFSIIVCHWKERFRRLEEEKKSTVETVAASRQAISP